MRKIYFFSDWLTRCTMIVFLAIICTNSVIASSNYNAQQENPLDIRINLNLKNATLSQFLNEMQKKVGTKAFFNMSMDDVGDTTPNITVNFSSERVGDILDKVLLKRKLTYTQKGNVFMIIKSPEKMIPQVTIIVVDEGTKQPISGVTLIVKGTTHGAITDQNGLAVLKNIKQSTEVNISIVGYKDQTLFIKDGAASITVKMKSQAIDIADVVITGYQVIDKRMSTSSVVSLLAKDIIEPVGTSLDQMLQGKIAGMSVMNQSSTVGAAPKIRIRGSSSILGNREPVWVLDGVILDDPIPLDATLLNSLDQINLVGNAISNLNPEDIERIDVLKDASATAIYGVKAANGVIVITTKRGKKGPASIRYSTSLNILERPKSSQMYLMNSQERIEVSEEMHARGFEYQGYTPRGIGYEGALQDLWDGKTTSDQFYSRVQQLKNTNTDWYKELFRNSFSHSHTLSISGATDVVNYYFSLGYSDQIGTPINESGDRLNFMSNIDIKISKRLSARMSLSSYSSEDKRPHASISLNKYAYSTSRSIGPRNEDGSLFFYDQNQGYAGTPNLVYNIYNELDNSGQTQKQQGYNANFNINYNIAKWLNWGAVLSYNTVASKDEAFITEKSYYAANLRETVYGYKFPNTSNSDYINYQENRCSLPQGGILESEDMRSTTYNGRTSLSFNKTFAERHSVSADAGLEIRSSIYNGVETDLWGYLPERGKLVAEIDPAKWKAFGDAESKRLPIFTDTKANTMSYYGTLAYAYNNKYILNANIRGDASNKLGMDKTARFLPIWSFSGRWNIEQEKFMDNVKWLSGLAVRASYGIQGNVTDAHNPNMLVKLGKKDSKSDEYSSTVASLPNKGLLWEKTSSFNVGLDFSVLSRPLKTQK